MANAVLIRLRRDLREDIEAKYTVCQFLIFDRNQQGNILSRVTNDVDVGQCDATSDY